ncbi:hypothetical protein FAIPA1_40300 [Frankia sp. AiPs1]|uniref:hypothetical protein n=1 Tax=Frankia sp. AiPa1 TaxID=573492 RepID=UPI00202AD841|nr:hypothetical protein [Frankia sp. AiPa1]MCL9761264.1 hypothetical protein [Frankia sp. AiPa1]
MLQGGQSPPDPASAAYPTSSASSHPGTTPPSTGHIEVRASGEDEFSRWLDVMVEGVAAPDTQGVPSHEEFPREVVLGAVRDLALAPTVVRYAAWHDGVLGGCASLRVTDGTAPPCRFYGVTKGQSGRKTR